MKVKVKKMGYYGNKRVKEGSILTLENKKEFSEVWMEMLSSSPSAPSKRSKKIEEKTETKDNEIEII